VWQSSGRPKKIWIIEVGYSFDTGYMDKVAEKKLHAELCNLPATDGYDVMLLPVVLESAGTLLKRLGCATKEMGISNARE